MASRSEKYNLLLAKNGTQYQFLVSYIHSGLLLPRFEENAKSVNLYMFWTCSETCGLKFKFKTLSLL